MSYLVTLLEEQASKSGDWLKAFYKLAEHVQKLEHERYALAKSRFVRINHDEDGAMIHKVTEGTISQHFDLADFRGGEGDNDKFLYLDNDGNLHPVTVGKQERINADEEYPFHYAASDLIANGKPVGSITFTDH